MPKKPTYRGRFAPTPTGPLHLGSLVSAMASYLEARVHQGTWHLRIDDIDHTRCRAGMTEQIIQSIHKLGFRWQTPIQYQQQHHAHYQTAIEQLREQGLIYACDCSRQQLRATPRYPGSCRMLNKPDTSGYALRVRTDAASMRFENPKQHQNAQGISEDTGDFIIRRRDGIIAYQLAVVVDDQQAQITHVVRGADLLDSTGRQNYLQYQLGYPIPTYQHIPLVLGTDGKKLSKSTGAAPIGHTEPLADLGTAWKYLQSQRLPSTLHTVAEFWDWAERHWQPQSYI